MGDGIVWIGYAFNGTLSRILVQYDQLSAPFFPGTPVSGLLAIGTGPGQLWVGLGNGLIVRLDPASLRQQATVRVSGHPDGMAVTSTDVWVIQFNEDVVTRIDSARGSVTDTIPLPSTPEAIAAGDGAVWVATAPDDRLWRIDPATDGATAIPIGVSPTAIAVGPGAVWVLGGPDGILERIDPNLNTLARSIRLGRPIGGIAYAEGKLWVTAR